MNKLEKVSTLEITSRDQEKYERNQSRENEV